MGSDVGLQRARAVIEDEFARAASALAAARDIALEQLDDPPPRRRPAHAAAAPAPAAVSGAGPEIRISAVSLFGAMRTVGAILICFVAFQLWGTGISEAQSQRSLKKTLRETTGAGALAGAPREHTAGASAAAVDDGSGAAAAPPVIPGGAYALIEIPAIGVNKAVVEGTGRDDLRKGPGHYVGSAAPGHIGNVAIAGHRTTYGAPFGDLDKLHKGDAIFVTSSAGRFKYVVNQTPFVVRPSQREVIAPTKDAELTLTTCHPKYRASQRLIVHATLDEPASKPPAPAAAKPATALKLASADAAVTGFDDGAWPATIVWALLLGAVWTAAKRSAPRWGVRMTWLVTAPVVLALLFEFFVTVNRLLPAYV